MIKQIYKKLRELSLIKNPWNAIYSLGIPDDLNVPYENFPEIIAFLRKDGSKKILDIAMGHGRHSLELISNGFEVYGFDSSDAAIKRAQNQISAIIKNYDVSKFTVGDMFKDFPFESDFFDAAIAIQAVYHGYKSDMQNAIDETARVLKSGGIFVFTVSTDITRSTTSINEILKREKVVLQIAKKTYLPLSGREKGLVHFYPDQDEIRSMLVKHFSHVIIRQDLKQQYFIVFCRKK